MDKEILKYKDALKRAVTKINELDNSLKELSREKEIAIIGYDCRFPGGANNREDFWNLLKKGYDAVSEIKEDRFNIDEYYSTIKGEEGKSFTRHASFLDGNIKEFDNIHFEVSAKESISIDPQHRLLLEVSWETIENSGLSINDLKGSKTGVFIGIDSNEYSQAEVFTGNIDEVTPYSLVGISAHGAAGRLSYFYDFKGPAISCNTACSSSLVALNMAVNSLKDNECDLAIVGGVNLLLSPVSFVGLSQLNGLAQDGRCKTFDERADGFGRGEGCGVIILKRLSDAKRDYNTIEGIVKGVRIAQDGRSNGFFAPNGLSEEEVIKDAIKSSSLSVNEIDYIEGHGTGTSLGDYIEAQAVQNVFKNKKEKIMIGSVKSNIGHLEAASGMAGLIKVLLAMKNKKIPESIHIKNPNKNINWDEIQAVKEMTDWIKKEGRRIAGINSFGISGTLAHLIVQEGEDSDLEGYDKKMPLNILTLSAKSEEALKEYIIRFKEKIETEGEDISNLLYTSNITRSHLDSKFAIISKGRKELKELLDKALKDEEFFRYNSNNKFTNNKVAFIFTGQGSIYQGIAKQLYDHSKVFKEQLDICDKLFKEILGFSIIEVIYNDDLNKLESPLYSQPVIFSIEYSLVKLWEEAGITPSIVLGHSIGEFVSACYSGLINLRDAIKMIAYRGQLMESINRKGKMVGILTGVDVVKDAITESKCENVSIAAINAPKNITISGLIEEVDKVIEIIQKKERVFINDLKINHPYHSKIMEEYEKEYSDNLKDIKYNKSKVSIISCVTGKIENDNFLGDSKYWGKHLSKQVNFEAAIREASRQGVNVFIEIGGDATLSGLAAQCIQDENTIFIPSLRKGIDDYSQFLNSLKTLYLKGIPIDWHKLHSKYKKEKVNLPNYPFKRKVLWKDIVKNRDILTDVLASENTNCYKKGLLKTEGNSVKEDCNEIKLSVKKNSSGWDEASLCSDTYNEMKALKSIFDYQLKVINEQNKTIRDIT